MLAVAHSIGAVYGRDGDNIPSASQAAALMEQNSIARVRIYDHNATILQAFASTQVRVIIAVADGEVAGLASGPAGSDAWVSQNISPYIQNTNIDAIAVGNEVLTSDSTLAPLLVPAMQNLYNSLVKQGLTSIKVSAPHGLGILELSSPPSAGIFFDSLTPVLQPLLAFLVATDSFFMLNVYPFYSYLANSGNSIPLDYALSDAATPVVDSATNLQYTSSYDAQVDAVVSAMAKLNFSTLDIVVTETGWPSAGDPTTESAANYYNAQTYNQNLVKRTMNNTGTPLRPGAEIPAYIVSLYDENLRPTPPVYNTHWGLFNINGSSKYDFDYITGATTTGGGGGSGGGGGGGSGGQSPGTSPSPSSGKTWCVAKPGAANSSLQQVQELSCRSIRALHLFRAFFSLCVQFVLFMRLGLRLFVID